EKSAWRVEIACLQGFCLWPREESNQRPRVCHPKTPSATRRPNRTKSPAPAGFFVSASRQKTAAQDEARQPRTALIWSRFGPRLVREACDGGFRSYARPHIGRSSDAQRLGRRAPRSCHLQEQPCDRETLPLGVPAVSRPRCVPAVGRSPDRGASRNNGAEASMTLDEGLALHARISDIRAAWLEVERQVNSLNDDDQLYLAIAAARMNILDAKDRLEQLLTDPEPELEEALA